MEKAQKKKTRVVQFAIIKEVAVESLDDLQAERQAFQQLKSCDRDNVVAVKVLEKKDGGGALEHEDLSKNWQFARDHFETVDLDWMKA